MIQSIQIWTSSMYTKNIDSFGVQHVGVSVIVQWLFIIEQQW